MFGPALVTENLSIVGALRRSWELLRNRWWRTTGLYLIIFGITLLPLGFAWIVEYLTGNVLLNYVLSTTAYAVSVPFAAIFTLHLFEDYRGLPGVSKDDSFGPHPKDFLSGKAAVPAAGCHEPWPRPAGMQVLLAATATQTNAGEDFAGVRLQIGLRRSGLLEEVSQLA
jgi:hypothetical protein